MAAAERPEMLLVRTASTAEGANKYVLVCLRVHDDARVTLSYQPNPDLR